MNTLQRTIDQVRTIAKSQANIALLLSLTGCLSFSLGCASGKLPGFSGLSAKSNTARPQSPTESNAQAMTGETRLASARTESFSSENNTQQVRPAAATRTIPVLHTLGPQDNLEQLIQQAPGVVVLDFYADWCGPCKSQGRVLHHLEPTAEQLNATIIKVNVDQHKAIAQRYQAKSLPTLVVLKNGQPVKRKIGLTDSQVLTQWMSL